MESRDLHKRFWVITQNQLVDYSYWDYVRSLYGTNITMPDANDFNAAYSPYVAGAYGTGTVAVMAMNKKFSELISEQNPNHRIFMDATWFVPEWAYERAIPRGLVLELSRQQVSRVEQSILESDREFWSNLCKKLLGDVIRRETTVEEVCQLVETIYVRHDLSNFKGDQKYVFDQIAQDWFGMARHATAFLYQQRCIKAEEKEEKQRMLDESIFAYKQTFALAPLISKDFVDLLSQIGGTKEAKRILSVREKIAARP